MTPEDWEKIEVQREATHQLLHIMVQNFEVTVAAALTLRDLLLLGLLLDAACQIYPCLIEDSRDLQMRLLEVTRAQQPDWTVDGELPESYGSEG